MNLITTATIEEVKENASEWIEMSEDPYAVVAGILANKVVELNSYVKYLERSIHHAYDRIRTLDTRQS